MNGDETGGHPRGKRGENSSGGEGAAAMAVGRLNASATQLCAPGVCLMSTENSAMYASCRCCLADHGRDTCLKADINGF
jgi:hypothetical protein